MTYGVTRTDAVAKVQALALRALAERMEAGHRNPYTCCRNLCVDA